MSDLLMNRSLNLTDYGHMDLVPYVQMLRDFRDEKIRTVWHRNDHLHRDWEYAEVLRKLYALGYCETLSTRPVHEGIRILDTGFGCSYFTQYLSLCGWDVHASDNEEYGAVREKLIEQCTALGTRIPLIIAPVEDHGMIPDGHFDVSLCISVIEHVRLLNFIPAWKELARVTKPGGYVFLTSDYFRDIDHWLHSEALGCQHNPFFPARMPAIVADAHELGLEMVGEADWTYHGDYVNNYSFVTMTFQKA